MKVYVNVNAFSPNDPAIIYISNSCSTTVVLVETFTCRFTFLLDGSYLKRLTALLKGYKSMQFRQLRFEYIIAHIDVTCDGKKG